MKFLTFSISFLVIAFSSSMIYTVDFNTSNKIGFSTHQSDSYLDLNDKIKSEDILSSDCTSCHMEYAMDGAYIIKDLEQSFKANLLVHKENDPEFIPAISQFLETHSEDEAALKYVDYEKVVEFVENQ